MSTPKNRDLRELRRLAKEFNINFLPPPPSNSEDYWPLQYTDTLSNISRIGEQKFDSFCSSIDIDSSRKPWREQTKSQAEYLAKRAVQLAQQRRNEAGWRYSLETDVLRRFSFEVACPRCRARIWRSEFEAYIKQSSESTSKLEKRRSEREPCHCQPEQRPLDYYELGENLVFDDRSQEAIIHDPVLSSEMQRKQSPDRVYGLRATQNFQKLFVKPIRASSDSGTVLKMLRKTIRVSPFEEFGENGDHEETEDPLLFPFLVVEAKSEKGPSGFGDILAQTALPIFTLLKLQDDLHSHLRHQAPAVEMEAPPLVWFFAYRGDDWRLYSCYKTNKDPTKYGIVQLWEGCIQRQDKALQLLLIVDYIFDWARDIYRPSILKQMRYLTSTGAYENATVTHDSDIASMRKDIASWIEPPPPVTHGIPDTAVPTEYRNDTPAPTILRETPIWETTLGGVGSISIAFTELYGLYLSSRNLHSLITLADSSDNGIGNSRNIARVILDFISLSAPSDFFSLTTEGIFLFEALSTDGNGPTDSIASSTNHCIVLAEMTTFLNANGEIRRQFSYLAISTQSLTMLQDYAHFSRPRPEIEALARNQRFCDDSKIRDAFKCIHSMSSRQVLMDALCCTALKFSPLPERTRTNDISAIECLALKKIDKPTLKDFITRFDALKYTSSKRTNLEKRLAGTHRGGPLDYTRPPRTSFSRYFIGDLLPPQFSYHEEDTCYQCRNHRSLTNSPESMRSIETVIPTTPGVVLVEWLQTKIGEPQRHHFHIIVLHSLGIEASALIDIITEIIQGDRLYHTIVQPYKSEICEGLIERRDLLWNLPCPSRPFTIQQRQDALDWIFELNGEEASIGDRKENCWDKLQLLLYYLKKGLPYGEAEDLVETAATQGIRRQDIYDMSRTETQGLRNSSPTIVELSD